MTTYKYITVHCSAGPQSQTIEDIRRYHIKNNGWSDIGYHFVIDTNGVVHAGRDLSKYGAHVRGHNKENIGICLIGGIENGLAVDNFTKAQKNALRTLVITLAFAFNIHADNVKGHRDWSPDLNKDGKITPNEYIKECPCFDVKEWFNLKLAH